MLVEGTLIANRYRVGAIIGESDLGILLRARHVMLDDAVVVKVLADTVVDKRLSAKFIREARNAARIKSDHVARFVDAGMLEDGRPYVVMENLEGRSLDGVISAGETIAESDAVDWMIEVCEALAAAHAIGIVHRDLRASSIFLATTATGHRTVKVMGFGTSRVADSSGREEDAGLTVAGLRDGAPDYAAPETFVRSAVDGRVDIWSVGAILFELLGRIRPFGGSPEDVVRRILAEPPPSLVALRPSVSPGLVTVIQRCLMKRPEERPADVAELATALAPFASAAGKVQAKRVAVHKTTTIPIPALPNIADVTESETGFSEASLHQRVAGGGVEVLSYDRLRSHPPPALGPAPRRSRSGVAPLIVAAILAVGVVALGLRRLTRGEHAAQVAPPPPQTAAATVTSSTPTAERAAVAESATATPPAVTEEAATTAVATVDTSPPPRPRALRPTRRPQPPETIAAPPSPPPPSHASVDDPWGWKR